MAAVAILCLVLLFVAFFWQWYRHARPAQKKLMVKWLLAIAAVVGAVFLFSRFGALIGALLAASIPLLMKFGRTLLRLQPLLFGAHRGYQQYKASRASSGQYHSGANSSSSRSSSIDTRYFSMSLDHQSGELRGVVLSGRFAGKNLADLSPREYYQLWAECQADSQSVAVYETYLERMLPDWRETFAQFDTASSPTGSSSIQEAYAILGLQPGATSEEIRSAHRRLMQKVHPDHGGSDYLAERINWAKDKLLNEGSPDKKDDDIN